MVEQPMGEMVGGTELAQAADGGGEGCRGGLIAIVVGEPGADEVAFGPLHRGKMPRRIGVQQCEQLAGGSGVAQVPCGAGGQRPRPAQAFLAYPEGISMGEDVAGVAQRGLRLRGGRRR